MAIKPHHIIEYQEEASPTNNNTCSCHHNWQNQHHDDGRSLEVFWWHYMDLDHLMYWQDGGNKRLDCIGSGSSSAIMYSVIYMYWALSRDNCASASDNDNDNNDKCPEWILVALCQQ